MRPACWYEQGIRFECQACGACCKTHGEYAYVYVTERDIEPLRGYLGLTRDEFVERYCGVDNGWIHLSTSEDDCPLLGADGRCSVYPVRPKQCATWPFWRENLSPAEWAGPVRECCPGIGRGRLHTREEIERIASDRHKWYYW